MASRRRITPVSIDSRELEEFARKANKAGAAMGRQLRVDIVDGGRMVVTRIRQNAARIPSRRIPRTVQLREDRSGRIAGHKATAGVRITMGGPSAPHARVWEPSDGRGTVRVPVFAQRSRPRNTWTWVSRRTKPYARPALQQLRGRIERDVSDGQLKSIKQTLGG